MLHGVVVFDATRLLCVAGCCSVLQGVAVFDATHGSCVLQGVAECCRVLQCLMQHTALV